MNIRTKTLLTVLCAVITLIFTVYIVTSTIIMKSFAKLEDQKIRKNTEILLDVIKARLENMDVLTRDWAYWDDAYAFAQNRNPKFTQTAISPTTCKDTNSNFIIIINTTGEILFSQGFDFEKNKTSSVSKELKNILPQPQFTQLSDKNKRTLGLVVLPDGLLMISARGILKTDYSGPHKGAVIFARYLDTREVKRLSEMAHLDFTLFEVDSRHWDPRIQSLINKFEKNTELIIEPVKDHTINCYVQLEDIYQQPAAIFKIAMPRDIYQQGRKSFYLLFFAIAIIGIIYLIVTSYLVDRVILQRLIRFVEDINIIEKQADLTHRLQVSGTDEFSALSKSANNMLEALQKAENAKNSFLAVISHEIRTPITGIVGMLELLKTEALSFKQKKLITSALASVSILLGLVNDILDYSRLRAGKITLTPQPCQLSTLMQDMYQLAVSLAKPKQLEVHYLFPPAYVEHFFTVDEFRLRQVLMNIINNALKFTEQGSITLETKIIPKTSGQYTVNISIQDTGTGSRQRKWTLSLKYLNRQIHR